jgi:hypothetical protein
MEKFLGQLPDNVLSKIFLFTAHPCADMIKDSIEEIHSNYVVFKTKPKQYEEPQEPCWTTVWN